MNQQKGSIGDLLHLPQATGLTPLMALTQFTFACIAMGGFLFNQTLTIDEELALFSDFDISTQGRFTLEILRRLLVPPSILPLAPYVFLATAYIFSYSTILHLHGLRHNWKTLIGFLVFILFPTNWLIQEWSSLAMALGVGLICSSLAALLTLESLRSGLSRSNRILHSIGAVVLLVFAIATFQSQITLYLTIGAGVTLFSVAGSIGSTASARFSNLLHWFLHAFAALAAYLLTTKIYLLATKQQLQHVNIYFKSPYYMLRTDPINYLAGNLEQFFRTYFTPGWFYGFPLTALALLVVGSIVLYMASAEKRTHSMQTFQLRRGGLAVAGWVLLLGLPLALNIVSTPNRIPMRALFALPYVAWLVTMIWLELAERFPRTRLLQLGTFLSCLLIFQSLVGISHYYAARALMQRSDQLVAGTIAAAMIAQPKQSQSVTHLLTKGEISRDNPYRTGWYSTAGSSFFGWDHGNSFRIASWLRAMGLPRLKTVGKAEVPRFEGVFSSMSNWPQPGSIKVEGRTLLVKLGPSD